MDSTNADGNPPPPSYNELEPAVAGLVPATAGCVRDSRRYLDISCLCRCGKTGAKCFSEWYKIHKAGVEEKNGFVEVEGFENASYRNGKDPGGKENGGTGLQNGAATADAGKDDDKKEEEKKEEELKTVGAMEVFRFAGPVEWLLMVGGTLAACCHGACLPLMLIIFGDMTDAFINDDVIKQLDAAINFTDYGVTIEEALNNETMLGIIVAAENQTALLQTLMDAGVSALVEEMEVYALYFVGIAAGVFVMGYLQISLWLMASYRQTRRIRHALFKSILKQEIGWFDTEEPGTLITRMTDGVNEITDGIGDKIGNFFQWFATFLAGFIIGFIYGWKLALVILAFSPLLAACGIVMTKLATDFTSKEMDAYAKAGAVAEEVLSSIRTVLAFSGQKKEITRYKSNLDGAYKYGVRKGTIGGAGMGMVMFVIFAVYCIAFWYGSKLVREDDHYTPGIMLIVFFCVVIAAFALGNAAPNLQNYATARGAAYAIYNIIDHEPNIDSSSHEGLKPSSVVGNVEFKDVKFVYPSRSDVVVMDGFSLSIESGSTVALVGSSGCGKSTSVQLLQRFYDPVEGSVSLDGNDLKDLNVTWLRTHIGVVSQEPILFAASIEENIRYGRDGVTHAEIEKAAIDANAHDFISSLPEKYNTLVGERGAQLSGGQKQRIAIARALVRDPKILLLDEATSALDTESEGIVQAALDKAREGRTTIVIAHRLSTVRNADVIVGIDNGVVKEMGTHDELMQQGGIYNLLVSNQSQAESEDMDEDDPEAMFRLARQTSQVGQRASEKKLLRQKSTVSQTKDGKKKEEEEKLPDPSMLRVLALNKKETLFIIIGCFASLINGLIQPLFAIIFASILGVYVEPDLQKQADEALFWSMMFLVIGVVQGLATLIQAYMFAMSGEALTSRLREMTFTTLMRQEMAYFDDPKNSTGALTTRLSSDASAVHGATGIRLGTIIQSMSSILVGVIIGFYFSWKLTLVVVAFAPFIMAAGWLQMKVISGYSQEGQGALESAGKVANESISNMRTVAMLNKEETFHRHYCQLVDGPYKHSMKRANLNGLTFGISQGILFLAYAACFYFGGWLIDNDGLDFEDMFKVFSAIVFGAMAMGQANSFAPDYEKAKQAAARIFLLYDRAPAIVNDSTEGEKPSDMIGSVEFREVKFSYPMRAEVPVLRGLDLNVSPGQMLALVGSSGCGKSTSIQLLERFYDAAEGTVLVGDKDITKLNIGYLREQMGLVQQEPILFACSIKDNIAYGDNSRDVPENEIIQAARDANIHDFISSLPQGYDTNVGDKGTQLSGGQKQRIAIARALVRNPKILLLDEATSALDTESEKVVQEALDRAQQGRTSIVIAHRLSTIQKADQIAVIFNGKVVELGTHTSLMAQHGFYFRLNEAQISTI